MKLFDRKYINLCREFSIAWFKLRDQRTVLGLLWSFLNPLIMSVVLYFLFRSRIGIEGKENYFLYILIGTVSWNFFSISVQTSLKVLLDRANMVRNVIFPKEILIISKTGVYIIQHLFEISVVFVFIVFTKTGFSAQILFLPIVIIIESMIICGLSLIFSCICVYARDMEHIWSVFASMGFFLVPIFYKVNSLSDQFRWVILLNPITHVIGFYRDILLYHRFPDIFAFTLVSLFSFILLTVGYGLFKLWEPKIVERA